MAMSTTKVKDEDVPLNGALYPEFSWGQTSEDIDVKINVPKDILKAKQIKVSCSKGKLSVSSVACAEPKDLVSGELSHVVNEDDVTWTLTPGHYVLMTIEKPAAARKLWTRLFTWENELQKEKLLNEVPLESLDPEEQAKIQELMWKERQKTLVAEGLAPEESCRTSQDQKLLKMLREAWDKEGSPFKGTPFNPDIINKGGFT